ncbi:MAG: hypothetical protein ABIH79_00420 [archaeon]
MLEQQKRAKQSIPKVRYTYAGKESLEEIIYKSFPRQLRPTNKTNTYLGIIFLAVLILAFINFPYSALTTGNTDITINVGYPLPFLEFNLTESESNPLLIGGLVLDLILYFFIAYIADVITNLILNNPLLLSTEDSKKIPKIFEDRKARTVAEKLTEKVIKKTQPPTKPNNLQSSNQTLSKK